MIVCDLACMYLLIPYVQFIGYCSCPPAEYLKVKTNIREEKVLTKGSSKRWLQAGGAQAPGGLSRSRQCAGRSCRSSPRTPAAARRSHSPCPLCAGSEETRLESLCCEGNPPGTGTQSSSSQRPASELKRTRTLDTHPCAVPTNGRPNLPAVSARKPEGRPVQSRVSGSTLCTPCQLPLVSPAEAHCACRCGEMVPGENHCLGRRRHDQGQPWGGLGLA